ncbi:hypothetical protein [Pedobacter sp. N23S346]
MQLKKLEKKVLFTFKNIKKKGKLFSYDTDTTFTSYTTTVTGISKL